MIPAYNEEEYLPRLLDSVDRARESYSRGPEAVEVVVADNASTDETGELASRRGCRVVRVEERAIAAARNGGAAMARGKILAFVDADSAIHPETFDRIEETLSTGRYVAGSTGVRLERWSLGIAMTLAVMVLLFRPFRMDSGVVFCRREDFEAVGGYNEERLFAEDVQFLWDLRRLGRRRGQRLVRIPSVKALGSTRKFDQHGDWHYFTQLFRLPWLALRSPNAITDFARRYWYEDR